MLDFDSINDRALMDYKGLLKTWFPQGKIKGNEFLIGDLTGKGGDSMSINVKTGVWCDFAGDGKGGDPISLWAAIKNVDRVESARQLGAMLNVSEVDNQPKPKKKKEIPEPPIEIPPGTAPSHPKFFKKVEYTKSWPYHNKDGVVIGYVIRFEMPDGKKETIPCRWIDGKWVFKSFPKPNRPLYNLHEIYKRPNDPIVIGEGEKTADALKVFLPGYVSVTWPGGTKAINLVDWEPIAGKKVIIFPDADAVDEKLGYSVGVKAANDIAERLMILGCNVKVVDVEGMPDRWDAADAFKDGWTTVQFIDWAKPRMKSIKSPDAQGDMPPIDSVETFENDNALSHTQSISVEEEVEEVKEQPHFRFLGVTGGEFFFYVFRTGQIISYTGPALEKKGNLYTLAPEYYWTQQFGAKKESLAMNALIRRSEEVGLFNASKIRGLGAWEDRGRAVLHLGDRLLINGVDTKICDFESKYIYEQQHQLDINTESDPLKNTEAIKLVDICENLRWVDRISGKLLAGWIFASIVCGAVSWRSHIYIIGPAGSGKSWVIDNIVGRILEGVALKVQSKTTEAGIRQSLGADARPVIFDEAETDSGPQEQARMQGVFDLARQASSGGAPIVKGSAGQKKNEYHVRSCFCFASINPSITQYADETRMTILRLGPPAKSGTVSADREREEFSKLQNQVFETLTEEFRSGLFARSVSLLPSIKHNQKVFSVVGGKYFGGQRQADQMSMMLAGLYAIYASEKITPKQACEWIEKQSWGELCSEEIETTETRIVSVFMQKKMDVLISGRREEKTVGEMIELVKKNPMENKETSGVLKRYGIKVDPRNGVVHISNTAEGIKEILKGTPWANRWHKVLMNIPGVEASPKTQRFSPGLVTQATMMPFGVLFCEEL